MLRVSSLSPITGRNTRECVKLRTQRPLWEDARVHVDTIRVLMRMSGAGAPKVFDKETMEKG